MSVHTRSQKLAQAAFDRISRRGKLSNEYASFAKKFPALIHTCGLAQAVAFALAKKETEYVDDLTQVLNAAGCQPLEDRDALAAQTRNAELGAYLRLSRDALNAAGWLKRYVEASEERN